MVKQTYASYQHLIPLLSQISPSTLSQFHVVVLPDFFVDHFLTLHELPQAMQQIKNIHAQGGGNIPGISQKITQGGNATNTALALARLGITPHLICRTDNLGRHLLEFFIGKYGVDLSGVKTDGLLAITAALEFGKEHVNVMLGDPGSVADFSYDILDDHDHQLIAEADCVCVMNWNLNTYGTTLAKNVLAHAKRHQVKTFFDTGDPSPRQHDITTLKSTVLTSLDLDVLGLNENELRYFSGCPKAKTQQDLQQAIVQMKKTVPARIDFHTAHFTCTSAHIDSLVPTLTIPQVARVTGAGDAWNAGNIIGELLGFSDEERLMLANLVAGWYVSSPIPIHPTIQDILQFLKKIAYH